MDEQEYKDFLEWINKKEDEAAQNKVNGYNSAYCDGRLQAFQDVKGYLEFIMYDASEE